ncbi:hypothetical protein [Micromonospora sp. NPDC049900]|uniref:hypothetical protein n=1 Tax=unclassified Micromonospora TaxID=2617518 RepID=UPI0037990533
MAQEELTVRPETLHRVGRTLGDTAYRVVHGPAGVPGLAAPDRRWSAAEALAALETSVRTWCGRLGAQVADTGDAVRAAAGAYESVDGRAATRLAAVPR